MREKKALEELCKDTYHANIQKEVILARDLSKACSEPGTGFTPTR